MNKFKLTSNQYELFLRTHKKHLAAFWEGSAEKEKRTLDKVKRVIWDKKDRCLKVYFLDGEWWHYTVDEKWYYNFNKIFPKNILLKIYKLAKIRSVSPLFCINLNNTLFFEQV